MLRQVIVPIVSALLGFAAGVWYCVSLMNTQVSPLNEKAQYLNMVAREGALLRALEREDDAWLEDTWLPRSEQLLSELERAEVACPLLLQATRVMGEFTCGYFDHVMPQLVDDAREELNALRASLD